MRLQCGQRKLPEPAVHSSSGRQNMVERVPSCERSSARDSGAAFFSRPLQRLGHLHRWVHIVAVCLFLVGCGNRYAEEVIGTAGGLVYARSYAKDRSHRIHTLRFHDQQINLPGRLVTTFGTLVNSAREDPQSDVGWVLYSKKVSSDCDEDPRPVSQAEIEVGFYVSDGGRKRGTPTDWVYIVDVEKPGWVCPEKLVDRQFIENHPYQWCSPELQAQRLRCL